MTCRHGWPEGACRTSQSPTHFFNDPQPCPRCRDNPGWIPNPAIGLIRALQGLPPRPVLLVPAEDLETARSLVAALPYPYPQPEVRPYPDGMPPGWYLIRETADLDSIATRIRPDGGIDP